MEATDKAAY